MFSLDYCLYWFRAKFFSAVLMAVISAFTLAIVIGAAVVGVLHMVDGQTVVANAKFDNLAPETKGDDNLSEDLVAIDKRVKADPENLKLRLEFANKLIDAKKLDRADAIINAFQGKIEDGNLAKELVSLGRIYMRLGKNPDAVKVLLQIKPDDRYFYEASFLVGEARLRLQDYRGVILAAEKIDQTQEAQFLKARAYYALGQDQKTANIMRKLISANAFPERLWLFRARIALDENDLDKAFKAAKQLIDAGGSLWDSKLIEIEIAIREGRFEDADSWLKQLENSSVNYLPIRQVRGLLHAAKGDYRAAASVFDSIENWSGSVLPRAHLIRAALKLELGDHVQAKLILSDHVDNAPDDWRGLFLLSQLTLEEKEIGRFKDLVKKISILAPQIDVSLYRQYQLAMFEGDYHVVRQVLNDLTSVYHLGGDQKNQNIHNIVRQSFFGPKAKIVTEHAPRLQYFNRLRALFALWNANEPQKALAYFESRMSSCADINLEQDSNHCETFQKLLHAELLLVNLKTEKAREILTALPESVQDSIYAIGLLNHLDVRVGKPELATARLSHYYKTSPSFNNAEGQSEAKLNKYDPQIFGEQLVFHYLHTGALFQAIELAKADTRLLEKPQIFKALAQALVLVTPINDGEQLNQLLAGNEGDTTERYNNGLTPQTIHLLDFLANYGGAFHRGLEEMLLSAQLYELKGAQPQAGAAYREALLTHTDDWRVVNAFSGYMSQDGRDANGRAFIKALLDRSSENKKKEDKNKNNGPGAKQIQLKQDKTSHDATSGEMLHTQALLEIALDLLEGRKSAVGVNASPEEIKKLQLPEILALSSAYNKGTDRVKTRKILNNWLAVNERLQGRDALFVANLLSVSGDARGAAKILENAITLMGADGPDGSDRPDRSDATQSGSKEQTEESDTQGSHYGSQLTDLDTYRESRQNEALLKQELIMARARLVLDKAPLAASDPEKSLDDLNDVEYARWAYLQQSASMRGGIASFYYQKALIKAGYHEMAAILDDEIPKLLRLTEKV